MNTVSIGIEVDQKGAVVAVRELGGEVQKAGGSFQKTGQTGNLVMTGLVQQSQRASQAQSRLARDIEATRGRLTEISQAQARLNSMLNAGVISAEQHGRALANLRQYAAQLQGGFNTASASINQLGGAMGNSARLGATLREVLGAATGIGIGNAVVMLVQHLPALINKLYDWDGANKRVMEGAREMNTVLLEGQVARRKFEEEIALVGLKGSTRIGAQQQFQDTRIRDAQMEVDRVRELVRVAQLLSKQETTRMVGTPGFPGAHSVTELTEAAKKAADELGKEGGLRNQLGRADEHLTRMIEGSHLLGREMKFALGEEATAGAEKLREKLEQLYKIHVLLGQIDPLKVGSLLPDGSRLLEVDLKTGLAALEKRKEILEAARRAGMELGTTGIDRTVVPFSLGSHTGPDFADVMASQAQRYRDAAVERFREIQEQHRQMVQEMAGHLRAFVANPLQYLKEKFMSAMFEMAAEWMLTLRGMQSGQAPRGGTGSFLGNVFGSLFGGGGSHGAASVAGGGGSSAGSSAGMSSFDVMSGLPLRQSNTASLFGTPLSAGGGAGSFAQMPAGSTVGVGARLKAAFPGMLASGIMGGGMMGAQMLGFGGPGRGAMSGALMGAAGLAAWAGMAGGNIMQSLGFLFGGPIGWLALGASALVGALFGILSRGKKQKQRDAVEAEAFRAIRQIKDAYDVKAVDYLSAIGQLEQVRQQVNQAMAQLKWPSRMDPHIDAAIRHINSVEQERQRRLETPFGPPQFAAGGYVNEGLARTSGAVPFPFNRATAARHYDSGGAVPIVAHVGEYVLNAKSVRRVGKHNLDAMNSGGSMPGTGQGTTMIFHGPLLHVNVLDKSWWDREGQEAVVGALRRAKWEGVF